MIAPQGRLCVIDDPATLDIMPFKRKSISIHWELMFTRSLFQTADIQAQHALLNEVSRLSTRGRSARRSVKRSAKLTPPI